jgi:sec-independent protein translocase protein TatA
MDILFAFIGMPGPMEILIIGAIAVLLFGKRLPEVGRSLGKGLMEFKKGLNEIEDEISSAGSSTGTHYGSNVSGDAGDAGDPDEVTAPKFEPPSSEPEDESVKA